MYGTHEIFIILKMRPRFANEEEKWLGSELVEIFV